MVDRLLRARRQATIPDRPAGHPALPFPNRLYRATLEMTLVKRVRCPGDNRRVQCLVALYRLAYCVQATRLSNPGRELASYVHTLTALSNAATAVPYSWSTYPGQ